MAELLWPRTDPRSGLKLCWGCWNNGEWKHCCTGNGCQCDRKKYGEACAGYKPIAEVRFTWEGQETLPETQ